MWCDQNITSPPPPPFFFKIFESNIDFQLVLETMVQSHSAKGKYIRAIATATKPT